MVDTHNAEGLGIGAHPRAIRIATADGCMAKPMRRFRIGGHGARSGRPEITAA